MEIGAYLCFSGIVWILGLAFVARARKRMGIYAALSSLCAWRIDFVLSILGMGRSSPYWEIQSSNIPEDCVARGAIGLVILLVAIVGLFSPAIAAWVVSGRPANSLPTPR
jgi:hypothetical protein